MPHHWRRPRWEIDRATLRAGLAVLLVLLAAQCVWFGAAMLINPRYLIAPNLFPNYGPGVQATVGVGALLLGLGGMLWPRTFGAIATMMVCGWRGWQAYLTGNGYAVGVWVIFLCGVFAIALLLSLPPKRGTP